MSLIWSTNRNYTGDSNLAQATSLCSISRGYDPKKATFGNILYWLEKNGSAAVVMQSNK